MKHTEGSGSILKSRFARGMFPLVAALLAFALSAPEARAEVLVYEGFSSADYTATSDYTASSLNGKKSGIDSIGLDTENGWNSGTGVFVAQPNGLPLPDIWNDGSVHGTEDLRAVLYNTTATSTTRDNRAQQRALTCTWPTSGSIYFRFLMQVPKDALSTSYLGNGNYWIAGLGTEAIEKPTTGDQCNIANGIYMGVRNRNGTLEVAAYVKNPADGATFSKPLFAIDTLKTLRCACIAKIDIGENGNDTLSFYAAPTNTLTTDFEWTFTTNGISLVSGSAKPSYLQMLGHYKVNSQYITFDEFLVTTDEDKAYAHASRLVPTLGTVAMSRIGTAEYSLSADEDANAADIAWIANDGASATTNDWQSVAEGGTANWTISSLTADKTYAISVLATNENGTVEADAGTLYTGVLSLGATTDANEKGLVAGGVTVSRVNDDSLPLTVNYTISGSAGTEGTTWEVPVAVTIPANAASAVLPVVPLDDVTVDEDVTITVTLLAGNYEMPGTTTATLTLRNRVPVEETDFVKKMTLTPSATALAKIGVGTFANFPVLVRLPAEVSGELRSANGTDLFFKDENNASLPFEVDTFNPAGETLVWVRVPSLSSATELTVCFGGYANADNDPTAVWTDYAGVWHMNEASGAVADATGHGLSASPATWAGVSVAYSEGAVGTARQTATSDKKDYLTIPSYDSLGVGGTFTFSCWYDATARKGYDRLVSRKNSYGDANGWEVEMANSNTTMSPRGASGTAISATIPDLVSSGWLRLMFVYSGASLKAYCNGAQVGSGSITAATDNGKPLSIGCDSDGSEAYFVGYVDEARLRKGALTAAEVALEHATMADAAFFDAGDIELTDPTAQKFATPTAVRNGNGSYTVSVVLTENNGDVGVIYDAGSTAITNILASSASPNTYTDTPANLTADTTYAFAAYGKNANDIEAVKKGGVFYTGDLSVERISDAAENDLVPGVFRISRADTAHDLTVAYTVGGTAVADQTCAALSGTATIPAGSTSVDIAVTPLLDSQTTSNTTVTVTLDSGLYGIDAQAGSAEMAVLNLVAPSGYNTWIATSNGLASVGSNWSEGIAPTSSDNILFDGRFSTKNCEWDSAASATVASWTQQADYTGTVQIDTTYDSTFPALNVTGNVEILGGNWTHKINEANDGQKYHLKAIVGGDFTLASGCKLDAEKKGYWAQKFPAGSAVSAHAASYDGFDKIYGNVYRPADLGAGSYSSGTATDNKSGGGAVWLEVGGAATLNGTINVRGRQFDGSNTACGSVYVKAKSCAGSGSILANFSAGSYYNGNRGAGGRVAIELTEATTLAFPTANVKINGINAGGSGGGGGTFYVKTADPAKPYGTLYLDDQRGKSYGARWHNPQAITAIPAGETWTFDAIVIRNYGMLAIPAGTTLNLPNGPMSISATSNRQGGIRYDGGTINWGSAPYEFASNWIFQANAPYTFDGNVVLHDGGTLGCLQFRGNRDLTDFTKCDITVNGDLTVEQGGSITAYAAGPDMEINGDTVSFHGGQSAGASGNKAYDSIFSPRLPGYGTANGDQATSAPGGGLLLLNVSGALVNNGSVGATGGSADNAGASGGSISITAGTLSGTGAFRANSASGSNGSGGGGRIAVRLTNGNFAEGAETNFFARGATVVKDNASSDKSSSAGTVYLQGKSDGEKGGTIYVRNDKNALNTNTYTPIPAGVTKGGVAPDSVADFKMAALVVGDCGRVKFFDELKLRSVRVSSGSVLDLNGKTLTVKSAKVNGVKLAPGTYAAGSTVAIGEGALGDYLVDTATGGALVVSGGGFSIIVR